MQDRLKLIGKVLPELAAGLSQMRIVNLKYNTLIGRLSSGSIGPNTQISNALTMYGAKVKYEL